tara:strand:+ start:245 stop:604 length:360 start_codon:yes stop_codon:yes gene_type:complete
MEILKNWNQYFNDANLSGILNLYDKDSILIPTFSDQILSDHKKIKDYFYNVLIDQKVSVEIIFDSVFEKEFSKSLYSLCGDYIFIFGKMKKISARFSFLVNPSSETPIKLHHSSRTPKN